MPMTLADLLAGVDGERRGRWEGVTVRGISTDSRHTGDGDLFVALCGTDNHGATFAAEAATRGASAVIVDRGHAPPTGVPALITPDPSAALRQAAARLYGDPSAELSLVGLTGTNGKTTVTYMVTQILAAAGLPAGYWSTNEVWSGQRRFRPALTTPMPQDIQRFLREVAESGMRYACMEVSSHAASQGRSDGLHWRAGVVTGVTPDHLDYHQTFANYLAAKRRFLGQLPPSALLAFCADDAGARQAVAGLPSRVVSYGLHPEADLRASDVRTGPDGSSCSVWLPGSTAPRTLDLPVPGQHNVQNALAAIAVTTDLGVPSPIAIGALHTFRPASRRLHLAHIGPYLIVDDVAMNDASVGAVLTTIGEMGVSGPVVVAALRGHRGVEVNALMARTLAFWNRTLRFSPLIATCSASAIARFSLDYRVTPAESQAFVRAAEEGDLRVDPHDELDAAIAAGIRRLQPGGTMVLLGTFGMDDGRAIAYRLLGAEPPETYPVPSFGGRP